MEMRVPIFAGRRILKKESLWDIRDYTYQGWQLYYAEYTDGLLKGCEIRAQDGWLVIGKGMLKFHNFIYLMMEEERVDYQPKNRWQVLKAEFLEDESNLDYKAYRVRFFLDDVLELEENQIEMCRFYLREGSALRDNYKNFANLATDYDTINLIYAAVAGIGEKTLHPAVLRQFGEEIWKAAEKETADVIFSYLIAGNNGRVERQVIAGYLQDKVRNENENDLSVCDNYRLYTELEKILRYRSTGRGNGYDKKIIYVE